MHCLTPSCSVQKVAFLGGRSSVAIWLKCVPCASPWFLPAPWPIEASAGVPPCSMSALAGRQPSRSLRAVRGNLDVRYPLMPMATTAEALLHVVAILRECVASTASSCSPLALGEHVMESLFSSAVTLSFELNLVLSLRRAEWLV